MHQRGPRKIKGAESLVEEIIAKKFPSLGKETYTVPGSRESQTGSTKRGSYQQT